MTPLTAPLDREALRAMYPERDGKRMSDNMVQARWIFLLYGNLSALLADNDKAFVAADNLWYPVEKQSKERQAPDVYVVFGRPKGDRGSYMQWLEDDIPVTVVFEIRSPGNSQEEMIKKYLFYDHHGVEEYYDYDPDSNRLQIYTRGQATLRQHRDISSFVSPRLGIRFEMTEPEMTVFGPNGVRFCSFVELDAQYEEEKERREEAERRTDMAKRQADEAKRQADEAKRQADEARRQADEAQRTRDEARRQADEAQRARDEARRHAEVDAKRADAADRLNVRLKELSRKARRGQATPEEIAELERLEDESA